MSDSVPALEVRELFHSFKNHKALNGVSFTVAPQAIHGFVGPNGAGKTTTLKIVATLLKPQVGNVQVFGNDVLTAYDSVRRQIGFMPDHFSMYRQMTVFEYLDFFAAAYGLNVKERDTVIADVLALTDMDGRQDELIKGLSRGMQQRVSLARVLVHDPKLLLLDEPASGLDPRARIELMDILRELARLGKTVFISSHILSELADLCDSVTILDRGEVKYTGTMNGLLDEQSEDGQRHIRVEVEPPDGSGMDAIEEVIRAVDGVRQVSAGERPHELQIEFDAATVSSDHILQVIIASNGHIVAFEQQRKHLNQAFMDLTDGGVREL